MTFRFFIETDYKRAELENFLCNSIAYIKIKYIVANSSLVKFFAIIKELNVMEKG